jgi:hypothetical protein
VWLLVGFLVAELLGLYGIAPWPTLSETTWHAIRTYPLVASGLFGLLIGLGAHLLYSRPLLVSLLFGIVVSAAAHLTDKAWP